MLSYYNVLGSAAILFFKGTISKLVPNLLYVDDSRLSFPSTSSKDACILFFARSINLLQNLIWTCGCQLRFASTSDESCCDLRQWVQGCHKTIMSKKGTCISNKQVEWNKNFWGMVSNLCLAAMYWLWYQKECLVILICDISRINIFLMTF